MNINTFLTCMNFFGVSTGASNALEGVYSFNSGFSGINSFIYNQIYPTGAHFLSGTPYGPSLPLFNLTDASVINNNFTGGNVFKVGLQHTGNFGVLLDIQYSGCVKRSNYLKKDFVLLSTVDNINQLSSGFIVGINDANRLFFKTQNQSYTLGQELSTHDFVYVGLSQNQYVDISIFNLNFSTVKSKDIISFSPNLNTPNIYIGGLLSNLDSGNYNNFVGKINTVTLFNNTLVDSDVITCSNCNIATGYSVVGFQENFSGFQITGAWFSGVSANLITGFANVTGTINKENGSGINVVFPSGVIGTVTIGEIAFPLYNQIALNISRTGYNFLYDTSVLNSFSSFNVDFDLPLTSGDLVEIYTYPQTNSNINNNVTGFLWPNSSGFIQLFGNGLAETQAEDFTIYSNQIVGFDTEDTVTFDVLNAPSIVTDYSGYWETSRISLINSNYFPPFPQYNEGPNGAVIISTLPNVSINNPNWPNFGYDLYMNGQKLISGLQYQIQTIFPSLYALQIPTGANYRFISGQYQLWDNGYGAWVALAYKSGQIYISPPIPDNNETSTGYLMYYTSGYDYRFANTQFQLWDIKLNDWVALSSKYGQIVASTGITDDSNYNSGYVFSMVSGNTYEFINNDFKIWDTGYSGWVSYGSFNGQIYASVPESDLALSQTGSGVGYFAVVLSGNNLPAFSADVLYNNVGGATGVTNVESSELSFLQQFPNFSGTVYPITSTQTSISNIVGFSEQIWVNGIRQTNTNDYIKDITCAFVTGNTDPPIFKNIIYESDNDSLGLWNFNIPPQINNLSNVAITGSSGLIFQLAWNAVNSGVFPSGNIEIWGSFNGNALSYVDTIPLNKTGYSYNYTVNKGGSLTDCGQFKLRYTSNLSGNIIGKFNQSSQQCG